MTGIELIAAERQRQIEEEGFRPDMDKGYTIDELSRAAVCYALPPERRIGPLSELWPFSWKWWKPSSRIRDLVKAGALIAAEIDRLQAS